MSQGRREDRQELQDRALWPSGLGAVLFVTVSHQDDRHVTVSGHQDCLRTGDTQSVPAWRERRTEA